MGNYHKEAASTLYDIFLQASVIIAAAEERTILFSLPHMTHLSQPIHNAKNKAKIDGTPCTKVAQQGYHEDQHIAKWYTCSIQLVSSYAVQWKTILLQPIAHIPIKYLEKELIPLTIPLGVHTLNAEECSTPFFAAEYQVWAGERTLPSNHSY